GFHVWSQNYDRSLSDVFALQDEIAPAVVAAPRLKLLSAPNSKERRTANSDAFNQYLLRVVDDARRPSVIDRTAKELEAHYVDPDVANRMITALRAHLAHGDYDEINSGDEFAATVTIHLRDVSHDLHLGLIFGQRGPEPSLDDQRAMARAMNYGFGLIE